MSFPRLALAAFFLLLSAFSAQAQFTVEPSPPPAEEARPGYGALADILEDEAARRRLIEDLRRLAAGEGAAGPPAAAAENVSLAQRVAALTRGIAEEAAAEITGVYQQLTGSFAPGTGRSFDARAMLELGMVIVVVFAVFWAGRALSALAYRRASEQGLRARTAGAWVRRWIVAIMCGLVDVLLVLAAWVIGYATALFIIGDGVQMNTRQTLFLNAFMLVETVKVVMRLLFASRYAGLRLLPVGDEDAAYWSTWTSRLASILGYGILVATPVVGLDFGSSAAATVSLLVYLLAFVMTVIVIRQNTVPFRERLAARAVQPGISYVRVAIGSFARIWHIVAIVYFAILFAMLFLRPDTAMTFIAVATVKTIAAIALGLFLSLALGKAIALGIRLPAERKRQFPRLEERVNAFVPATLKTVRAIIAIAVVAIILDAWSFFDTFGWLGSEAGAIVIGRLFTVAIILVATGLIWLVVSSWIEYRLREDMADGKGASARERTLLTIFRNAFTIALVVIAAMILLSELGINIGPLLAGAGVLGLAIGFGAQKLVQDVINGVFIQLENAMNTGDVVTAGGTTGVVEKLTVRSVGIRDLSGTYHLIPFSSVETVSNFMKGFSYHVGEYGVAYRESVDEVVEALRAAFEELRGNPDNARVIVGDLEVHGITEFADSSVNVRVRIKTLPGQQWALGRTYNGLVKKHFDARSIEIPFPHLTLYFGEDKKGNAPPAPIRIVGQDAPTAPRIEAKAEPAAPPPRKPRRRKAAAPETSPEPEPDIPGDDEV